MKRTRNTNQGADTSPHLSKNPKAYPTSSSMSSTNLPFNNADSSLVCEIQLKKIWIQVMDSKSSITSKRNVLQLEIHDKEYDRY